MVPAPRPNERFSPPDVPASARDGPVSQPPAELQFVREILDAAVDALARRCPDSRVVVQQHRLLAVLRLHQRRHLARVQRATRVSELPETNITAGYFTPLFTWW